MNIRSGVVMLTLPLFFFAMALVGASPDALLVTVVQWSPVLIAIVLAAPMLFRSSTAATDDPR